MQLSTLAKRGSQVLFVVVVAFYLFGLGHLPLLGPDEPRYAQIAREMFLRRDLITPTLGGHPWFEKPALLYWMMIASYKVFGVSEWSARLPAAVAGLLTVGAVYYMGRSVERRFVGAADSTEFLGQTGTGRNACPNELGFWSALATATTLGIVAFSRAASFDIIVTMTMTWALAFFFIHDCEEDAKAGSRLLAGFYVFVGLSLLAKGLIGIVIPFGIAGAYYLFRRTLPEPKVLKSVLWGIPLSLAVAALWYGPVTWRNGWPFIDQFFVQHQFARYVSNKYGHPAPVYFYLLILIPLSLPWTAFLVDGIWKGRHRLRRTNSREVDSLAQLLVFAFAWLIVPLLFFSFSTSKLPGYIIPVLPAIAIITGVRLSQLNSKNGRWPITVTATLCLLVALTAPIYVWRTGRSSIACVLLASGLLGLAGIVSLFSSRRQKTSVLLIAGATVGVVIIALVCWAPELVERETSKRLLQLADQRGYSQTAIYGLQRDDRSPQFYAGERVVYGPDQEPIMYESPAQVIDASLALKRTLLVFVPVKEVGWFIGLDSAQAEVIGDNGRIAIVAVTAR